MAPRRFTRRHFIALGGTALLAPAAASAPVTRAATRRPRTVDFSMRLSDRVFAVATSAARGWRTTRVLRAPARFDILGLRWTSPRSARVEVRTRRKAGRWSDWVRLPDASHHGPDGSGLRGTEPAWTAGADCFQLRFDRRLRGVEAHFVNSTGTITAAGRARAKLRKALAPARRLVAESSAARSSSRPAIIPRSEWGGDDLPPRSPPEYGTVKLAFVHHTVGTNGYDREDSAAIVRGIERYHRNTNGWNDIGYNFLVDKYGQIFEGRAGGIEEPVVGAQAAGYNSVSTGVSNLGTFSTVEQTDAGIRACANVIAWKLALHGVPVVGSVVANGKRFQRISGHRDANSTACPGDALYGQLDRIRQLAAAGVGPPEPRGALAITSDTGEIKARQRVLMSGVLTLADGSQPSGQLVELQIQGSKGYRTIARVRTTTGGRWSIRLRRSRNARLRARARDVSNGKRVYSPGLRLRISPRVQLNAAQRRVSAGGRVLLRGRVRPAKRRVVVQLERRTAGGRFRAAGRVRLKARGGRFSGRVRLRRPGLYRISVRSPADTLNGTGRSTPITVRAGGRPSRRGSGGGGSGA